MPETLHRYQARASVQEPYGFLSYGRNPGVPGRKRPPNEKLSRFRDLLSEHLGELTDLDGGVEAVYFDQRIPLGEGWEGDLKKQLARCQVLVPVLSPRLFTSKWCAVEWECFERRQQLQRERGTFTRNAIVPVLWTPLRRDQIPPPYCDVQYTHEDLNPAYFDLGLLGLHNRGRHKVFNEVAYQLAEKIVEVAVSARLEPCDPGTFDDLFDSVHGSAEEEK